MTEERTTKPTTIPVKTSLTSESGKLRMSSLPSSVVNIVRTLRSTSLVSHIGLLPLLAELPWDEEATLVAFIGGAASKPLSDCDSSSRGFRFIVPMAFLVFGF